MRSIIRLIVSPLLIYSIHDFTMKNAPPLMKLLIPALVFTCVNSASFAAENAYLTPFQAPNSLEILPEPPQADSASFARDQAIFKQMRQDKNEQRWKQAIIDADVSNEHLGRPFSEAFGVEINQKNTPVLFEILKKIKLDSRYSTQTAKKHYSRERPYAFFNVQTCTPDEENAKNQFVSYPSGHTTIGWTYALVLAQLRPERQNEIFKRGIEFGQSRVVCNMHWQSDVDAGRLMGAAQFSRLQADPQFQADMIKAKTEIYRLISKNH